jgi:hypothetical protein
VNDIRKLTTPKEKNIMKKRAMGDISRRRRATRVVLPLTGAGPRVPEHASITQLAYQLWEQSGGKHGDSLQHWLRAEQLLINIT